MHHNLSSCARPAMKLLPSLNPGIPSSNALGCSDGSPTRKRKQLSTNDEVGLSEASSLYSPSPGASSLPSSAAAASRSKVSIIDDEDEEDMADVHATLLSLKSDTTASQSISCPDPVTKEVGECIRGTWGQEEDSRLQEALLRVLGARQQQDQSNSPNKQKKKSRRTNSPRIDWQLVSEYMGGTRSPKQCYGRYWNSGMNVNQQISRGEEDKETLPRKQGAWSAEEDKILLRELKRQQLQQRGPSGGEEEGDSLELSSSSFNTSWARASDALGGTRTRKQCMIRYNSVLRFASSTERVSGLWKVSEDRLLAEGVRLYRGMGRKGGVAWSLVSEHMGHTRTTKQCKKRWDDAFMELPPETF